MLWQGHSHRRGRGDGGAPADTFDKKAARARASLKDLLQFDVPATLSQMQTIVKDNSKMLSAYDPAWQLEQQFLMNEAEGIIKARVTKRILEAFM